MTSIGELAVVAVELSNNPPTNMMLVSAPLSPRLVFPDLAQRGAGFMFTDAARAALTGHGAISMVRDGGELLFIDMTKRWPIAASAVPQSPVYASGIQLYTVVRAPRQASRSESFTTSAAVCVNCDCAVCTVPSTPRLWSGGYGAMGCLWRLAHAYWPNR